LHQSKPHPCRHCLDPARLAKKNNGTWWVQTTFLAVSVSRRWWQGRNPGPPANLPARLPLAVLANHPQRRPAGRPGTRWPSVRSNCMLASPSALSKSAEQRSISIFRPPLSISYYIVRPSRSIVTACRPYACMSDVTNLNSDDHARLWAGTGSAQSEKERTWQTASQTATYYLRPKKNVTLASREVKNS
jgi:hypothetical protein